MSAAVENTAPSMWNPLLWVEAIKNLGLQLTRGLTKGVTGGSSSATFIYPKWGLNVVLTDGSTAQDSLKFMPGFIKGYHPWAQSNSVIFTDHVIAYQKLLSAEGYTIKHTGHFDPMILDTFVIERSADPSGTPFVLFDLADTSAFETESFKALVSKMDLINVTVYILLPAHRAPTALLKQANKVFMNCKPRKVAIADRIRIYNAIFGGSGETRSDTPYSQFLDLWLQGHREKKQVTFQGPSMP